MLGFGGAGPEEGVAEVADAFRRPTFNTTVSNVEGIASDQELCFLEVGWEASAHGAGSDGEANFWYGCVWYVKEVAE